MSLNKKTWQTLTSVLPFCTAKCVEMMQMCSPLTAPGPVHPCIPLHSGRNVRLCWSGAAVNSQSLHRCWLWPPSIKHWLRATAAQESDRRDQNMVCWLTCVSHTHTHTHSLCCDWRSPCDQRPRRCWWVEQRRLSASAAAWHSTGWLSAARPSAGPPAQQLQDHPLTQLGITVWCGLAD